MVQHTEAECLSLFLWWNMYNKQKQKYSLSCHTYSSKSTVENKRYATNLFCKGCFGTLWHWSWLHKWVGMFWEEQNALICAWEYSNKRVWETEKVRKRITKRKRLFQFSNTLLGKTLNTSVASPVPHHPWVMSFMTTY